MIAHFDNVAMMRAANGARSHSTTLAAMFAPLREMIEIVDRAGAAAHRYEELSTQSDEELAAKGLKRSDLPRKAFEETRG
jgi:hypothetical protein